MRYLQCLIGLSVVYLGACFTDTEFWPKQRPVELPACTGECVAPADLGWTNPMLFWVGQPGEAPACPASAPTLVYEGFTGLGPLPIVCPPCECSSPVANCAVPTEWTVYNADTCDNNPILTKTSFDAPAGWDGSCTNANSIPSGELCFGVYCVQGFSIPQPVFESYCAPTPPAPPNFGAAPWPWTKEGRACTKLAQPQCPDPETVCEPSLPAPNADAWRTCIFQSGEHECPKPYKDGYTFYQDVDNSGVSCSPCTCSEPEGASCQVFASIYGSDDCTGLPTFSMLVPPITCVAFPGGGGMALGSKEASLVVDPGGPCTASGSEVEGKPVLVEPVTFCCK